MRQLASIKEVKDILPIEGKDRIELAIVDAWNVIIKKDEFKVGDKCIYVEIDSVMPDRPEFDFLREGVVCRTLDGQRSFKAVDPEFLIKYDE